MKFECRSLSEPPGSTSLEMAKFLGKSNLFDSKVYVTNAAMSFLNAVCLPMKNQYNSCKIEETLKPVKSRILPFLTPPSKKSFHHFHAHRR